MRKVNIEEMQHNADMLELSEAAREIGRELGPDFYGKTIVEIPAGYDRQGKPTYKTVLVSNKVF